MSDGSGEQRILFIGWSLEPIISNKRQVMSFVCSHGFMVKLWHRPKSNCHSGILPPAVISCVITLHWPAQRGCPSEETGCGWSGNITLLCIEDIISDALLSLQSFNESNFNSVKQLSSLILWRSTTWADLWWLYCSDGFALFIEHMSDLSTACAELCQYKMRPSPTGWEHLDNKNIMPVGNANAQVTLLESALSFMNY